MSQAGPAPAEGWDSVSAVIVTFDRPALLERTIDSVLRQTHPVDEIIVSDDGHREATRQLLLSRFPNVRHVPGPSRGIAANLNNGVREARGTWVLLCNDDAELDPSFVELALGQAAREGPHHVYHAAIREHDRIVLPNAIGYLGYLTRTVPTFRYPAAINTQAMFLNRELLTLVEFDERMVFGYEEIDFACRAAWAGFPGRLVSDCINTHLDPGHSDAPYKTSVNFDSNRIYMRFKSLWWIHRQPVGAIVFLWVAFAHLAVTQGVRKDPRSSVTHFWRTWNRFLRLLSGHCADRRSARRGAHCT